MLSWGLFGQKADPGRRAGRGRGEREWNEGNVEFAVMQNKAY